MQTRAWRIWVGRDSEPLKVHAQFFDQGEAEACAARMRSLGYVAQIRPRLIIRHATAEAN